MKMLFLNAFLLVGMALSFSAHAIVGGSPVNANDEVAAYTVGFVSSVNGEWLSGCSGVIISDELALTAAHCLSPKAEKYFLAFALEKSSLTPQRMRRIDKVAVPPEWVPFNGGVIDPHDIALLHFVGGLPAGYRPAKLLRDPLVIRSGADVVIAGFGVTEGIRNTGGGVLRSVHVQIADPALNEWQVSIQQDDSRGSCHGDSGGPALINVDGESFVWGVSSAGINSVARDCRTPESSYTLISAFEAWIQKTSKAWSAGQ